MIICHVLTWLCLNCRRTGEHFIPGVFHEEIVVQRNPWQRSGSRLYLPLSPGELRSSSPFFSFQPHMINLILTWGSYDLRNQSAWWCYSLTDTNSICTQELPKYLRGYHHCTKEEMVQLAALLFRVKVENDKTQLVMITKMLKELVPNDQLKAMSAEDWKKVRNAGIMHVIVSYYTTVLLNAQSW